MVYLIGWNEKVKLSAKLQTFDDADELKARMRGVDLELIEVGRFSYWLMKNDMPKLAMLPFWR